MSQVATELGISSTGINLNLASVRNLAGRPSGTISMSDLRGKSAATAVTQNVTHVAILSETGNGMFTDRSLYVDFSPFRFINGSAPNGLTVVSISSGTPIVDGLTVRVSEMPASRTLRVRLSSNTGVTSLVEVTASIGYQMIPQPVGNEVTRTNVTATVLGN